MNLRYSTLAAVAAFSVMASAQDNKPAAAPADKPAGDKPAAAAAPAGDPLAGVPMDKVSYFIGKNIGTQMSGQGFTPDYKSLADGMRDAIEKKDSKFPQAELEAAMEKFRDAMMAMEKVKQDKAAEADKAYLVENGKKKGVTTTASGLQDEVLKAAEGPKPAATDTVTVHYKGTLVDGTEFDSSYSRNEPAKFPLNGVIPGWTEGVQLMSKGSKFKFTIPGNLAYGPQGSPPKIGPNATLVFEVELLEIAGK